MFDVGFWELAIIGVVALVIVGPERLPGLARTAGLWVGKGRRMLADVKRDIDREIKASEMAELQELKKDIEKTGKEIEKASDTIKKESGVEDIKESLSDTSTIKDEIEQDMKEEVDEIDAVSREFDDALAGAGDQSSSVQSSSVNDSAGESAAAVDSEPTNPTDQSAGADKQSASAS